MTIAQNIYIYIYIYIYKIEIIIIYSKIINNDYLIQDKTLKFLWLTVCFLCGSSEEIMFKIREMKLSGFGTN